MKLMVILAIFLTSCACKAVHPDVERTKPSPTATPSPTPSPTPSQDDDSSPSDDDEPYTEVA